MCWIWRHLNVNAAWNLFHNGIFIQIFSPMTLYACFKTCVYMKSDTVSRNSTYIPHCTYWSKFIGSQMYFLWKSKSTRCLLRANLAHHKMCVKTLTCLYFEKVLLRTNQIWSKQCCNYWAQEHVCNRIQDDTEIRLKETSAKTL